MTIRPTLSDPADDRAGVLRTLLSGIHPLRLAVLISIVDVVIVLAAAVVFRIAIPSMSPLTSALVVTALLSVLVPLAVWKVSGFREAGFTGPREWRNLHLLLVPALLAVVPVLAGFRPVDALATLIVGYALTGFMEEALWRGLVLRVLRPIGPPAAALFGSMLFGAAHLVNVMFRDSVALVAAQAFGAACFGVGYAAVAMRIGTIWPLMVLHTLTDLFAAVGALPKIPILVGQDIVLLVFGLWFLHTPAKPGPTSMNQRRRRARGIDRAAGGA